MKDIKFTGYFLNDVLKKRPDLKVDWCLEVLSAPVKTESQEDGRIKHWGFVAETGKYFRVITLADGETIHNAFPDRRFKP